MTEPVSNDGFKFLCDRLNGKMPTPATEQDLLSQHEEVALLFGMLKPASETCQLDSNRITVYAGQRLSDTNEWINPYTQQVSYRFKSYYSQIIFVQYLTL
jgi:hypothetical protein